MTPDLLKAIGGITTVFGAIGLLGWAFLRYLGSAKDRFGILSGATVIVILGVLAVVASQPAIWERIVVPPAPVPVPVPPSSAPVASQTPATTTTPSTPASSGTSMSDGATVLFVCGNLGKFEMNRDRHTIWLASDPTVTQESAVPYYEAPDDDGFWIYHHSQAMLSRYRILRQEPFTVSVMALTMPADDYSAVLGQVSKELDERRSEIDSSHDPVLIRAQDAVAIMDQHVSTYRTQHGLNWQAGEATCHPRHRAF